MMSLSVCLCRAIRLRKHHSLICSRPRFACLMIERQYNQWIDITPSHLIDPAHLEVARFV